MAEFKDRLKEAMVLRNITQAELCTLTKISKSAISQYLSGNFKPKQNRIYILAKALNVSEAWLMGYDVSPTRTEKDDHNPFSLPDISKLSKTHNYDLIPILSEIMDKLGGNNIDNNINNKTMIINQFDERMLLSKYRLLDDSDKHKVRKYLSELLSKSKYI